MVLLRTVFQAKFGKADNLVAALKSSLETSEFAEQIKTLKPRILTDISGEFDTVVIETTHNSLAAIEQFRQLMREMDAASDTPSPLAEFIVGGRNEYYTIEY